MAQIIDGKALSLSLREQMRDRMPSLIEEYGRRPSLAVVIVGDDPASRSYVRAKIKAAAFVGIDSLPVELPADVSEDKLLERIGALNDDDGVDGILVQLPLPAHIDKDKVIDCISLEKDVDGFHPLNASSLWLGRPCILPCTPKGIMALIESTGVDPDGKRAVVVGRSNIVGKPVAKLLQDRNATVTVVHSHTADLPSECALADILVVAAGKAGLVDATMIKPGAVVIDVGINRVPDGRGGYRVCGDVDFESASAVASYISPVPGGVGPMTVTMLMQNTIECFLKKFDICHSQTKR